MSTEINVLVCANKPFFQHLAVMLTSLVSNNQNSRFNLVVVTGDGQSEERRKLERTISRFHTVRFSIRDFRPEDSISLHTPGRYTTDNYTRLWVGDFFGPEVEKVLYLDADIVVLGDISKLWMVDLEGKMLGAVDIPGSTRGDDLGLPRECGYFNSGVLLIDLAQWRSTGALATVLSSLDRRGRTFKDVDQDALNVCFHANRKHLAYKWNVITPFYTPSHDLQLSSEEIDEVKKEGCIIHFNGRSRPWSYLCRHHRKPEYYTYLAYTEWRTFTPADRTPINVLRKIFGPLLPEGCKRVLRLVVGHFVRQSSPISHNSSHIAHSAPHHNTIF